MPHLRDCEDDVKDNPSWRADDINQAFADPEVDLIITAIG